MLLSRFLREDRCIRGDFAIVQAASVKINIPQRHLFLVGVFKLKEEERKMKKIKIKKT